jgi:hypothetical protein
MTQRDEQALDPAAERAAGKDVDGLVTLPGVHSTSGVEKAGTGDDDQESGIDPAVSDVASDVYPRHPTFGGPPPRHG